MKEKYINFIEEKKTFINIYRYKYYFLALPILLATVLLLMMNVGVEIQFQAHELRLAWTKLDSYQYVDLNELSYFIKTEGCTIPAFDPFDPLILKYHFPVQPIVCHNETNPPLINSNLTSIWIEEKYFSNFNITNVSYLNCCYRPFYRQDVNISKSDNRHVYDNCTNFIESARIHDEFVRVECMYNGTDIYKDFHAFVHSRNDVKKSFNKKFNINFNVLILGIDAVSRLNFHRTMPNTLKQLKNINAAEFKGYNKVGDNTYPNLIPVLSGLSDNELKLVCASNKSSTFDDCPFIWKNYAEIGYSTALAEDAAPIALFNYLKNGFASTPTDYYWRTFDYLAEAEIGHEKRLNAKLCLGPRMTVDVLLEYVYKFVKTLYNQMYFGFFWETSLTHDFLNYPLLADEKYSSLINKLQNETLIKNTIVIVLSDHGIRWGEIRTTHQGRMEERLPFLFISLPQTFKDKYPLASSNLQKNTKRLTTPFDLHETLLDLVDVSQLEDVEINERIKNISYSESRGISLFLPINEQRTCEAAGIDPHWCTCHQTKTLNVKEKVVISVANIVINHINNLLNNYIQCAMLNLTKIVDARVAEPSESLEMKGVAHIVYDYTVVIHTEPGDGAFEATVRHSLNGWNVTGTVSRLNLYGKQSYCMDNFHLKLYCFCDNPISKIFR